MMDIIISWLRSYFSWVAGVLGCSNTVYSHIVYFLARRVLLESGMPFLALLQQFIPSPSPPFPSLPFPIQTGLELAQWFGKSSRSAFIMILIDFMLELHDWIIADILINTITTNGIHSHLVCASSVCQVLVPSPNEKGRLVEGKATDCEMEGGGGGGGWQSVGLTWCDKEALFIAPTIPF